MKTLTLSVLRFLAALLVVLLFQATSEDITQRSAGGSVATGNQVNGQAKQDTTTTNSATVPLKPKKSPPKQAPKRPPAARPGNPPPKKEKEKRPYTQQELELIARFNLSNAVKVDAVSAAVEYLVKQQAEPNSPKLIGIQNTFNRGGKVYSDCANNPQCPVCNVSLSAILVDGLFVHNKEMSAPPYDYTCWSMRIRYHVAPACAEEELSRNVEPIYKWRWTLGAAEEGYCKMPDVSPHAVGIQHQQKRQAVNKQEHPKKPLPRKKDTTILFLGLSFLSEPFMAMGCLFGDQVTGGRASLINPRLLNINKKSNTIINPYPHPFAPCTLEIADIRKNGGQCTGFERENIIDFFPPQLHQGWRLPIQNFNSCTMDHAVMEFGDLSVLPSTASPFNGDEPSAEPRLPKEAVVNTATTTAPIASYVDKMPQRIQKFSNSSIDRKNDLNRIYSSVAIPSRNMVKENENPQLVEEDEADGGGGIAGTLTNLFGIGRFGNRNKRKSKPFGMRGGGGGVGAGEGAGGKRQGVKAEQQETEMHRVLINSDGSKTTVCFVYTFVVEVNVPPNTPLPCLLKSWMDIDVVISLLPYDDYVLYAERKNWGELEAFNRERVSQGKAKHEIHFLNVNNLYENILTHQLKTAYRNAKFEQFEKEDFLAKFKKCGRGRESNADIHYRMPGLPDFAAQMWLSYVATGVDSPEDRNTFEVTKSNNHKDGMRYWL